MRWAAVAAPDMQQDLILFDGDFVLCSHWAHVVNRRDASQKFKFVSIQSPYGRVLAQRFGIDMEAPQTNLAVVGGQAYFKSDAALAVLGALPGFRWTGILRVIAKPVRNWLYDRVARNRYRLFGRREACWIGDPALRARIIEHPP